jgi:beta-aspartyl-peptidase (threonine type)
MRSLIVHGGAWQIPDEEVGAHIDGLRRAIDRGAALLREGAPALDVVVETIVMLEDDPTFDAGLGAVLNRDGRIEMDASVMDGDSGRAGACLCVTDVPNPIRLARAILDDGRAVILAGEGASRFAREAGIPTCRMEELILERERNRFERLRRLEEYRTRQPFDGTLPPERLGQPSDTVGAVCCDARGGIAAATSTGGAPYTLAGRVGDSPVLGAGTWAEAGLGGASATGWGESILRDLLAFRAVQEIDTITIEWRPRRPRPAAPPPIPHERITWGPVPRGVSGTPAARAARDAIGAFARRVSGVGGVILLGPDGSPGFAFNTPRMARGYWMEGMGEGIVEIEPAGAKDR